MNLTWIGQGGFLFAHEGRRIAIDPYLSDVLAARGMPRLFPPPFTPESLAPTLLVSTHDHIDHYDPDSVAPIMAANPDCQLAGPVSVISHAEKMNLEKRAHCLNVGKCFFHGTVTLTPTPADHSDRHAIGLLIDAGGTLVWLSGDTLYHPELPMRIRALAGRTPDVVLICINGRLGNMTREEALLTVGALRPRVAIPMHYGLFAANTADPNPFVQGCRSVGIHSFALKPGQEIEL